jgi:aminoglycoside 6'-N-acetyltransferase
VILHADRITLRPFEAADLPAVAAMLAEPEVARWWGDYDEDRLRREHLEAPDSENLVIEVDGQVAGLMLVYDEEEPEYRHAALDISLATAHHGQGLGRRALRLVIDHLVAERGHHRFTIDPSADNERAIRSYRAVGFRPVGILRKYWRAPDGTWRDGLMMDLLAEDL